MKKGYLHSKIWREGKYLDFWSIIHIVDGMLMTSIGIFLGFSFLTIFLISLAILLLWEFVEPPEHLYNKLLDMITSIAGLLISYFLIGNNKMGLIIIIIIAVSLNFWAWVLAKNYRNFYKKV